jgi:adenylate cyclase class IV
MAIILEFLGLSVTESFQKHRTSYKLDDVRFDLDKLEKQYAYIPHYLEIEAKNLKVVQKYAKLLGYSAKDCLP